MLRASNAPRDRPPVAGPKSILRKFAYGRTPAAAHDEPSHSEVYSVNERGTNPSTRAHCEVWRPKLKRVSTAGVAQAHTPRGRSPRSGDLAVHDRRERRNGVLSRRVA
jgi:hypothetical protein